MASITAQLASLTRKRDALELSMNVGTSEVTAPVPATHDMPHFFVGEGPCLMNIIDQVIIASGYIIVSSYGKIFPFTFCRNPNLMFPYLVLVVYDYSMANKLT